LSANEAAERYGISRWTLYRWALEKRMPSYKIGRLRKFSVTDLDQYFEHFKSDQLSRI
jgi:excisionase family DNA binding protein